MKRGVLLTLLLACRAFAGQPFGVEDLWLWRSLSDPRISSDGRWVAYVETWNDRDAGAARSAIWLASADGQTHRRLADGTAPRFSPDGSRIAFTTPDGAFEISTAGGSARPLSGAEARRIWPSSQLESAVTSPDGRKVAFLARDPKPRKYVIRKLCVRNADGSNVRPLSGALDRDAASPQWSSDSRTVYFLADDRGSTHVYAARNDGTLRQVTSAPERLSGLSVADNGRAVSVTSGMELISFSVFDAADRVTLAAPNREWLSTREFVPVEKVAYESAGWNIDAWITRPVSRAALHPALLLTDAACGEGFDLRSQILASAGFIVFCANPRGTPGNGEEFGNLLPTRDPADAFDDLMRGVDFLIAKAGVDPKRIFISGGTLAAWAMLHSDRFAAALARRPRPSSPAAAIAELQSIIASRDR